MIAFPGPADYNSIWFLMWNVIPGHNFQSPSPSVPLIHIFACPSWSGLHFPHQLPKQFKFLVLPLSSPTSTCIFSCPSLPLTRFIVLQKRTISILNNDMGFQCISGRHNTFILGTVLNYFIRPFLYSSLNNPMRWLLLLAPFLMRKLRFQECK